MVALALVQASSSSCLLGTARCLSRRTLAFAENLFQRKRRHGDAQLREEGVWLEAGRPQAVFFLGCVVVAGVYGAATASRKILFIQAVPATLGLLALFLSR